MMKKLEDFFLPIANKLAQNRYLTAIRNGFIAILPVMIVGSFFTLINNVIIGENGFTDRIFGAPLTPLLEFGNAIVPATMSIMAILLTFTTAKSLAETYGDETSIVPTIAVVSLFILMPVAFNEELGIEIINTYYTGAASMFSAFIAAIATVELTRMFSKVKAFVITMPDSVPPAISRSFNKLIPVTFTILVFGLIRVITNQIGMPLNDLIFDLIQTPFTTIVSSGFGITIIYFLYMLLWGLGIHTAFIFNPILEPIFLSSLTDNETALAAGEAMTNVMTKPFLDSVAFMGGAGNMLALIVAILLVSRRADYKSVAKLGLAPALFNISEPIMFGLPVVMNPILIIPMIISTLMGLLIGVISTAIGFMGYTHVLIPWTTPPIIGSFLATGGSWGAVITTAVIFALSVAIYVPFVIIMNKQKELHE